MKTNEKPNIILLVIDALRADYLGCYNPAMKKVSPHIDSLAKKGILFKNVFAQGSGSLLALPGLMTGTYSLSYGGPGYVIDERPHIAEILRDNDYHAMAFSPSISVSYLSNHSRGFHEFYEYFHITQELKNKIKREVRQIIQRNQGKPKAFLKDLIQPTVLERLFSLIHSYKEYLESVSGRSARIKEEIKTLEQEVKVCREDIDRYLVDHLQINLMQVTPKNKDLGRMWMSGREWVKKLLPAGVRNSNIYNWIVRQLKSILNLQVNVSGETKPVSADILTKDLIDWTQKYDSSNQPFFNWVYYMDTHKPYLPGNQKNWIEDMTSYLKNVDAEHLSKEQILRQDKKAVVGLYKACINYADEYIAKLVEHLKTLERNTILIITSDHGEEFFEHGDNNHLAKLYDEMIHVPLILYDVKESFLTPQVKEDLMGHVDFIPTLTDILNLENDCSFEGQSILKTSRDYVISESLQSRYFKESFNGQDVEKDHKIIAVRTQTEKLIYYERENRFEYFDLITDPCERKSQNYNREKARDPYLEEIIRQRLEKIKKDVGKYGNSLRYAQNKDKIKLAREELKHMGYIRESDNSPCLKEST